MNASSNPVRPPAKYIPFPSKPSDTLQATLSQPTSLFTRICRHFWSTCMVALLAGVSVGFTIFFAYNATRDRPLVRNLIASTPERTIIIITSLTHVNVLLMNLLLSDAFEAFRWMLIHSPRGISASTFITLGRATSPLGVLNLVLFGKSSRNYSPRPSWHISGHHFWGCQRYSLCYFGLLN